MDNLNQVQCLALQFKVIFSIKTTNTKLVPVGFFIL